MYKPLLNKFWSYHVAGSLLVRGTGHKKIGAKRDELHTNKILLELHSQCCGFHWWLYTEKKTTKCS